MCNSSLRSLLRLVDDRTTCNADAFGKVEIFKLGLGDDAELWLAWGGSSCWLVAPSHHMAGRVKGSPYMVTGAAEFPKALDPKMLTEMLLKARFFPLFDVTVSITAVAGKTWAQPSIWLSRDHMVLFTWAEGCMGHLPASTPRSLRLREDL